MGQITPPTALKDDG